MAPSVRTSPWVELDSGQGKWRPHNTQLGHTKHPQCNATGKAVLPSKACTTGHCMRMRCGGRRHAMLPCDTRMPQCHAKCSRVPTQEDSLCCIMTFMPCTAPCKVRCMHILLHVSTTSLLCPTKMVIIQLATSWMFTPKQQVNTKTTSTVTCHACCNDQHNHTLQHKQHGPNMHARNHSCV